MGCQPGAIETDGPVPGVFGSEDQVVGSENVRGFNRAPGELAVEAGCTSTEGAGPRIREPERRERPARGHQRRLEKTLRFLDEALRASATAAFAVFVAPIGHREGATTRHRAETGTGPDDWWTPSTCGIAIQYS